jgi:hypothetical protein
MVSFGYQYPRLRHRLLGPQDAHSLGMFAFERRVTENGG